MLPRVILLSFALAAPLTGQLASGVWRAWLDSPGGELPFRLEIVADGNARIGNGEERIDVPLRRGDAGSWIFDFPHYGSAIHARLEDDRLRGTWRKRRGDATTEMAFHAVHGVTERFPAQHPTSPPKLSRRWAVDFEKDEQPAVCILEDIAPDGAVRATFLTALGDYRYLEGLAEPRRLRLSCFDGAHAFLFDAALRADGTLAGSFWSSDTWHETWVARPDAQATLTDAWSLTKVRAAGAAGEFGGLAFPDVNGARRSLDDPAFAGRARLLVIFGSWCPNCHDEAAYLAELHQRYRARGLSILGLAFERTGDHARDAEQVRRFAARHGLEFPILIAGLADKEKASQALPLLDRVRAYPTTVFLHGDGRLHRVHTGYSGPATGAAHAALRAEFEATIDTLLAEAPPGAPAAASAPAADAAEHGVRDMLGWTVHVHRRLLAAPELAERVVAELHSQLHRITRVVPAPALAELRQVPIWIHRHRGPACMAYHPSAQWLRDHGRDPRLARSVEIGNAQNFLSWTRTQPWMVLHELAHAYHHRVLGFDHAGVRAAFEQARAGGAYDSIRHIDGRQLRHYAMTDAKEYFAEASEALFGTNDMFPFVSVELRQHDPAMYALARQLWGLPD